MRPGWKKPRYCWCLQSGQSRLAVNGADGICECLMCFARWRPWGVALTPRKPLPRKLWKLANAAKEKTRQRQVRLF